MDKTGFHCEQDRDRVVVTQQDQQEKGQEQEQEKEQEQEQEQEYDRYKNNPQLLAETCTTPRLFSFDWCVRALLSKTSLRPHLSLFLSFIGLLSIGH